MCELFVLLRKEIIKERENAAEKIEKMLWMFQHGRETDTYK